MQRGLNILRIRAHPRFEQAAMRSLDAEPMTAVGGAVDAITQVWYVAVVVVAGGSSIRSFGTKC